ncbi:MAG: hypothetical protein CMI27_02070 [Opitutae bacterium]|nr:hypothetical protein [Opitutae bacterium]
MIENSSHEGTKMRRGIERIRSWSLVCVFCLLFGSINWGLSGSEEELSWVEFEEEVWELLEERMTADKYFLRDIGLESMAEIKQGVNLLEYASSDSRLVEALHGESTNQIIESSSFSESGSRSNGVRTALQLGTNTSLEQLQSRSGLEFRAAAWVDIGKLAFADGRSAIFTDRINDFVQRNELLAIEALFAFSVLRAYDETIVAVSDLIKNDDIKTEDLYWVYLCLVGWLSAMDENFDYQIYDLLHRTVENLVQRDTSFTILYLYLMIIAAIDEHSSYFYKIYSTMIEGASAPAWFREVFYGYSFGILEEKKNIKGMGQVIRDIIQRDPKLLMGRGILFRVNFRDFLFQSKKLDGDSVDKVWVKPKWITDWMHSIWNYEIISKPAQLEKESIFRLEELVFPFRQFDNSWLEFPVSATSFQQHFIVRWLNLRKHLQKVGMDEAFMEEWDSMANKMPQASAKRRSLFSFYNNCLKMDLTGRIERLEELASVYDDEELHYNLALLYRDEKNCEAMVKHLDSVSEQHPMLWLGKHCLLMNYGLSEDGNREQLILSAKILHEVGVSSIENERLASVYIKLGLEEKKQNNKNPRGQDEEWRLREKRKQEFSDKIVQEMINLRETSDWESLDAFYTEHLLDVFTYDNRKSIVQDYIQNGAQANLASHFRSAWSAKTIYDRWNPFPWFWSDPFFWPNWGEFMIQEAGQKKAVDFVKALLDEGAGWIRSVADLNVVSELLKEETEQLQDVHYNLLQKPSLLWRSRGLNGREIIFSQHSRNTEVAVMHSSRPKYHMAYHFKDWAEGLPRNARQGLIKMLESDIEKERRVNGYTRLACIYLMRAEHGNAFSDFAGMSELFRKDMKFFPSQTLHHWMEVYHDIFQEYQEMNAQLPVIIQEDVERILNQPSFEYAKYVTSFLHSYLVVFLGELPSGKSAELLELYLKRTKKAYDLTLFGSDLIHACFNNKITQIQLSDVLQKTFQNRFVGLNIHYLVSALLYPEFNINSHIWSNREIAGSPFLWKAASDPFAENGKNRIPLDAIDSDPSEEIPKPVGPVLIAGDLIEVAPLEYKVEWQVVQDVVEFFMDNRADTQLNPLKGSRLQFPVTPVMMKLQLGVVQSYLSSNYDPFADNTFSGYDGGRPMEPIFNQVIESAIGTIDFKIPENLSDENSKNRFYLRLINAETGSEIYSIELNQ